MRIARKGVIFWCDASEPIWPITKEDIKSVKRIKIFRAYFGQTAGCIKEKVAEIQRLILF